MWGEFPSDLNILDLLHFRPDQTQMDIINVSINVSVICNIRLIIDVFISTDEIPYKLCECALFFFDNCILVCFHVK